MSKCDVVTLIWLLFGLLFWTPCMLWWHKDVLSETKYALVRVVQSFLFIVFLAYAWPIVIGFFFIFRAIVKREKQCQI